MRKRIKSKIIDFHSKEKCNNVTEDVETSKRNGNWLICDCVTFDVQIMNQILDIINTEKASTHENFRLWVCTTETACRLRHKQPSFPEKWIIQSEKYAIEIAENAGLAMKNMYINNCH